MNKSSFILKFSALVLVQILLWNFCSFSPMVTLVILPMMIMSLPIKQDNIQTMLIAFVIGFCVDFLADGMLGLTSFSLVPIALCRKIIIRSVLGPDILSRKENPSIRRNGFRSFFIVTVISSALFLILFIWADGAGTRPFSINLMRFILSLLASTLLSLIAGLMLASEDR